MKTVDLADFNELLLELYRHSSDLGLDEFQDAALELVRPLVPFDTSMWGTATMTDAGPDMHAVHLHRTPQAMLDAYEHVKHEDSAAALIAQQGTATGGFNSESRFAGTEMREFLRRFKHENVFISMETNPATRFVQWVSLFRADGDALCRDEESQVLTLLRPHLMQALSMNRRKHLDQLAPVHPGFAQGRAVADLRGVIYHCDPHFEALMRAEWGGRSDALPADLLERLRAGEEQVMGRTLVVQRHVAHRLLFLKVRLRCRADLLTSRERVIARLIAQGETHKEIARSLARAPATVRNQIQAIYAKLEVGSIAGLIAAMRPME
jgi:DNA-binding CsgD family transcriptional regulator